MSESTDTLAVRLDGVAAALCSAALHAENPGGLLAAVAPEQFRGSRFGKLWQRLRDMWDGRGSLAVHELLAAGDVDAKTLLAAHAISGVDSANVLAEFRALAALAEAQSIALGQAKRYGSAAGVRAEVIASIQEHMLHLAAVIDELEREQHESDTMAEAVEDWISSLHVPSANWRLTTGIEDLDERIGGGMAPGTLTIALARSGHGKSSMAVTAAVHAARAGQRVLYVSREMPTRELCGRFVACARNESLALVERSVASGNIDVIDEVRALGIFPVAMRDRVAHIASIASLVHRERLAGKPFRLVILDYLQMLDGPGEEQHQRLEAIAYGAKTLAMDCDCAMLVPAQPNREGSKRDGLPAMSDIRGSSAIENAADNIVSMLKLGGGRSMDAELFLGVEKARQGLAGELTGKYTLGAGDFFVRQVKSERARVELL